MAQDKPEQGANYIRNSIEQLLQNLEISRDDFRSPQGRGGSIAHQKVVAQLLDAWQQTRGFGKAKHGFQLSSEALGIDFVGREWGAGGIVVAVEVDTGHLAHSSWTKLCDIRTEYRVWVYLTRDENVAEENFGESVGKIKLLLRERSERRAFFGELLAILKTPTKFEVETICPVE